jgi:hypothetical protein
MADPSNIKAEIARQIFIALQRRGADKLLTIIENYGDTLSDAEMLLLLQEYNITGRASYTHRLQSLGRRLFRGGAGGSRYPVVED